MAAVDLQEALGEWEADAGAIFGPGSSLQLHRIGSIVFASFSGASTGDGTIPPGYVPATNAALVGFDWENQVLAALTLDSSGSPVTVPEGAADLSGVWYTLDAPPAG